jgi:hypothetical protein
MTTLAFGWPAAFRKELPCFFEVDEYVTLSLYVPGWMLQTLVWSRTDWTSAHFWIVRNGVVALVPLFPSLPWSLETKSCKVTFDGGGSGGGGGAGDGGGGSPPHSVIALFNEQGIESTDGSLKLNLWALTHARHCVFGGKGLPHMHST